MFITLWLTLAQAADPETPTPAVPVAEAEPSPSRALRQARGMKVAGTVLTSVGIATGTLSAGLAVWGAAMTPTCEFECMGPVFAFSGGAIGAGITGVFLGAGIPLWVVGQRHERELSAPLQTMIVVPTADRHGGGVAMAFQF